MKLEKFNNLIDAFSSLPTVGKKSALRFAYHLVLNDTFCAVKLANAIECAVRDVRKCEYCGSISEHELCDICLDDERQNGQLCIVDSAKDIFILEENRLFEGRYFVLNSLEEESILKLKNIIKETQIEEIIFAFSPCLASDAMMMYIEDKLKEFNVIFTKIAQGVPTGVSLENIDVLSLSKAIKDRKKV
ncbi:MAG: recombination mediator RecR [Campylobacteraceae bacterium]|jgi:recombination protein RecR|nr:recombination mediator RecR [Campylobacteraceae bacterium]